MIGRYSKIAVMHSDYVVRGGAERKSLIYAAMLRNRAEVEIICGNFSAEHTFSEYIGDTPIRSFPYKGPIQKLISLLRMAWAVRGFDLLIVNNYPSNLSAALAKWAFRKPVIWFCNEAQLHLVHAPKKGRWALAVLKFLEKRAVSSFEIVIANSGYTAGEIRRIYAKTARVIYSGLDLKRFPDHEPSSSKTKTLILVSRIEPHKQIDTALRLFESIRSSYAECQLIIVGSGSALAAYQAMAGPGVSFTGAVLEAEKLSLLSRADLFIFPTLNEPLGVTPLEAMAAGLPVVAFKSGGVSETVINGETGFLVEDEAEFVAKSLLLIRDALLCSTMRSRAMRHVRESSFSQECMVAELVKEIERLS